MKKHLTKTNWKFGRPNQGANCKAHDIMLAVATASRTQSHSHTGMTRSNDGEGKRHGRRRGEELVLLGPGWGASEGWETLRKNGEPPVTSWWPPGPHTKQRLRRGFTHKLTSLTSRRAQCQWARLLTALCSLLSESTLVA